MVSIKDLRHRIEIQTMTRVADGQGGHTVTWAEFATVWAKVEPKSAMQKWRTDKLEENITHLITIRKLDSITSEMRIFFDNRYFHIKGHRVIDEKRFFMEIYAVEGDPS